MSTRTNHIGGGCYKALSLFSGCGTLDLGFEREGFEIVAANEMDPAPAETYRRNHPAGTLMVEGDIRSEEVKARICAAFSNAPCDAIIGGPPCTGFTTVGLRDPDDPRNGLWQHYADLVEMLRPEIFVFENVRGILTMPTRKGGSELVIDAMTRRLETAGYRISVRVLDSADYGSPQHRERVIIVGAVGGIPVAYPQPTYGSDGRLKPYATVREAIGDLADAPEDAVWSHVFVRHGEKFLRRVRCTPVGGSAHPSFSSSFKRLDPDLPSPTVQGAGTFLHPELDRCLTMRELARLQDFPDSFRFSGSMAEVHLMIRNAVPVRLGQALAASVRRMLDEIRSANNAELTPAMLAAGRSA